MKATQRLSGGAVCKKEQPDGKKAHPIRLFSMLSRQIAQMVGRRNFSPLLFPQSVEYETGGKGKAEPIAP